MREERVDFAEKRSAENAEKRRAEATDKSNVGDIRSVTIRG